MLIRAVGCKNARKNVVSSQGVGIAKKTDTVLHAAIGTDGIAVIEQLGQQGLILHSAATCTWRSATTDRSVRAVSSKVPAIGC
jgi:hypothetical protein